MPMGLWRHLFATIVLLAAIGCTAPPDEAANVAPDAGGSLDADPSSDVRSAADLGLATDAGMVRPDAGLVMDAQAGGDVGAEDAGGPAEGRFEDFSLGPYPSAHDILVRSLRIQAARLDTREDYRFSASQGYVMQGGATFLRAEGHRLPGGESARRDLLALAIGEADELIEAAALSTDGGPAFGLDWAWDAFGDGSENPAFTPYAWQSGVVALGFAELVRYLHEREPAHPDLPRLRAFLHAMLEVWASRYTEFEEGGETLGYFWYSTQASDAKAVHNTSSLIARATSIYVEIGGIAGEPSARRWEGRAQACATLLARRAWRTPAGGLAWNYVDDGWPVERRNVEDIEHSELTLAFVAFAHERGWWTDADMGRVATTMLEGIWTGHPALMNGRIDGSTANNAFNRTRWVLVGMAAHSDAVAGRPALFDYVRSMFVSARLTPSRQTLDGAQVGAPWILGLARLFAHRPRAFRADSRWSMAADEMSPEPALQFSAESWSTPALTGSGTTAADLMLNARSATSTGAAIVLDLPRQSAPVVVSVTYRADVSGAVSGDANAPLPASRDEDGRVRWMRTSFMLPPDHPMPARLSLPAGISVHRVEATPER